MLRAEIITALSVSPDKFPVHFEVLEPAINARMKVKGSSKHQHHFVMTPHLVGISDAEESSKFSRKKAPSKTNWIIAVDKKATRPKVEEAAKKSVLLFDDCKFADVKDTYSSFKDFVLDKLYSTPHHGSVDKDVFYDQLLEKFSTKLPNTFARCINHTLSKCEDKDGFTYKLANCDQTWNMYRDDKGKIRFRVIQFDFSAEATPTAGGAPERIAIPGKIVSEFVLTDEGFQLTLLACSNQLMRDLCLSNEIAELRTRVETSELTEEITKTNFVGLATQARTEKLAKLAAVKAEPKKTEEEKEEKKPEEDKKKEGEEDKKREAEAKLAAEQARKEKEAEEDKREAEAKLAAEQARKEKEAEEDKKREVEAKLAAEQARKEKEAEEATALAERETKERSEKRAKKLEASRKGIEAKLAANTKMPKEKEVEKKEEKKEEIEAKETKKEVNVPEKSVSPKTSAKTEVNGAKDTADKSAAPTVEVKAADKLAAPTSPQLDSSPPAVVEVVSPTTGSKPEEAGKGDDAKALSFKQRHPVIFAFLIGLGVSIGLTLILTALCFVPVVGPFISAALGSAFAPIASALGITAAFNTAAATLATYLSIHLGVTIAAEATLGALATVIFGSIATALVSAITAGVSAFITRKTTSVADGAKPAEANSRPTLVKGSTDTTLFKKPGFQPGPAATAAGDPNLDASSASASASASASTSSVEPKPTGDANKKHLVSFIETQAVIDSQLPGAGGSPPPSKTTKPALYDSAAGVGSLNGPSY